MADWRGSVHFVERHRYVFAPHKEPKAVPPEVTPGQKVERAYCTKCLHVVVRVCVRSHLWPGEVLSMDPWQRADLDTRSPCRHAKEWVRPLE